MTEVTRRYAVEWVVSQPGTYPRQENTRHESIADALAEALVRLSSDNRSWAHLVIHRMETEIEVEPLDRERDE